MWVSNCGNRKTINIDLLGIKVIVYCPAIKVIEEFFKKS